MSIDVRGTRLEAIKKRNERVTVRKGKTSPWPLSKRMEVVSQYLILGNAAHVAAVTGVQHDLVRKWKREAWWPELEKEIRASQNLVMDAKITTIVDKSLDATLDRVENGDFIYDQKTGEMRRKPAALRDVHRVAADLLQRREVLRDAEKNQGGEVQLSTEEHLKILAQKMAAWFETEKPVIELVEDITDAIPKEREAGL